MKRLRLLLAALLAVASPALGQVSYPNSIYSSTSPATKRDGTLTQQEWLDDIDEINAIETELGANYAGRGVRNLVANGSVEMWSAGTSAAPDNWTLSGTGAVVARQADGQDGAYSAQITAGSVASKLDQVAIATINATTSARLRGGVSVIMSARVTASAQNACRLQIGDGIGTSQSTYHSGGGAWELLSVVRTLDTGATQLFVDLLDDATDSATTCRFDSVQLFEGKFPPKAFAAGDQTSISMIGGGTVSNPSNIATNYFAPWGTSTPTTAETDVLNLVAVAATATNLRCQLSAAPDTGAGVQSYAITLRVNGASSLLSVTISEAATTGGPDTDLVSLAAGDRIDIMVVPTGTPTAARFRCGFQISQSQLAP